MGTTRTDSTTLEIRHDQGHLLLELEFHRGAQALDVRAQAKVAEAAARTLSRYMTGVRLRTPVQRPKPNPSPAGQPGRNAAAPGPQRSQRP